MYAPTGMFWANLTARSLEGWVEQKLDDGIWNATVDPVSGNRVWGTQMTTRYFSSLYYVFNSLEPQYDTTLEKAVRTPLHLLLPD